MARYALLYFGDQTESEPSPESEKVYADIFKWFEDHHRAGHFVDGGEELAATHTATTIRKANGKVTVVDGPFVEAKEAVGGYSIIEAPDMAAALEIAKTWPGQGVEVRPIVEH
ncbi:MAG TPA: YciI family protein [Candidatus Limnocylindria bacterium]